VKKGKGLAGALIIAAVALGSAIGCSDSPTSSQSAPTISQLRVQGANRVSGSVGLVGLTFDYADPDRDIARFVFAVEGGSQATNALPGATQQSGEVSVQQTVELPAAGVELSFAVSVMDRRGNRSNELRGVIVAPN
jgi:hypothetical protein